MQSKLCLIQFPHPGGEAPVPATGDVPWNVGDHYRKFLRSRGDYVGALGEEPVRDVELGFWGEWEAQTKATPVSHPVAGGPEWIHDPYYDPSVDDWRQNTDPFVFGQPFHYTGCRQHVRPKKGRPRLPTQLTKLERGSVIVFGSVRNREFVVDTVFVVSQPMIDHNSANYGAVLDGHISSTYREVTIDSWYSGPLSPTQTHRLYFGATYEQPVEGMFSFFPCALLADRLAGFGRPPLVMDQITPRKATGFKKTILALPADALPLWSEVVRQVRDEGLLLGVRADLPPRRRSAAVPQSTARTEC